MPNVINSIEPKELRWLRMDQLTEKLAMSERTIRRLMKTDPLFPKPMLVLDKTVVFWEFDADLWMLTKVAQAQGLDVKDIIKQIQQKEQVFSTILFKGRLS